MLEIGTCSHSLRRILGAVPLQPREAGALAEIQTDNRNYFSELMN